MNKDKSPSKALIEILFCFAYSFILSMSDVCFPVSGAINYSDSSIYQYLGHLILSGKFPYVDAFDHKGIILYFINCIGCLIDKQYGIWVINFIFMAGILFASIRLSELFVPLKWTFWVCTIIYSDFANGWWVWNTPDFFSVLFNNIAIYLLYGYFTDNDLKFKIYFWVGLCFSCSFWLKQTTVTPVLILLFLIVFDCFKLRKHYEAFICVGGVLAGFFVLSFGLIIYFICTSSYNKMIEDFYLFNYIYVTKYSNASLRDILNLFITNSSFIITILLSGASLILCKMTHANIDKRILYGMISLAVTIFVLLLPGRLLHHYYLICYPLFIWISSCSTGCILSKYSCRISYFSDQPNKFLLKSAVCATFIYVFVFNMVNLYSCGTYNWRTRIERRIIVNRIAQLCEENDMIAVATAHDCGIYLWSGHESATSYPYIQEALFYDRKVISEYNEQIRKIEPRVILWRTDRDVTSFLDKDVLETYCIDTEIGEYRLYFHKD